jgi:hemoglobin-like flavoprotein
MTPEDVVLVQDTMRRLAPRFYDNLFRADPDLRLMFSTDPVIQQEKFTDELEMIVVAIADLGAFLRRAGALGARHGGYGVRASHYPLVRDALLATLAEVLDGYWTAAHAQAWRVAYDMVAEAMLMGRAPAPGPRREIWSARA